MKKALAIGALLLAALIAGIFVLRSAPRSEHGSAPADPAHTATAARARRPAVAPTRASDPARVAPPSSHAGGEVAASGKWGSELGQFGHRRDPESNPEAPSAIVAGKGGDFVVLDQINNRVQRFEQGRAVASIGTGGDTVQDVAIGPEDRTVVLDRLADKVVRVYDAAGRLVNEVPLAGKRLEDPASATGVFADEGGIYVEREHGALVRVADPDGTPDEKRRELPGRPTRDGKRVVAAALTDRAQGEITITAFAREGFEPAWSRPIVFGRPILHVLLLDSDDAGNVYVGALSAREGPAPDHDLFDEAILVARLTRDGTPAGILTLPATKTGEEVQRPLSVGEDGTLYLMRPGEQGLDVLRYGF